MPRIRREATRLVHRGWSARKVGRYFGFHHTAVMEWYRRAKIIGDHPIPIYAGAFLLVLAFISSIIAFIVSLRIFLWLLNFAESKQ